MATRNNMLCVIGACFLVGLMLFAGFFSIAAIATQSNTNAPCAVRNPHVYYPNNQTAAKTGDQIIMDISVSGVNPFSCDASAIGSSVTDLYDDGNYAVDRDRTMNDGVYTNIFTVNCASGYQKVTFDQPASTSSISIIVNVDNNLPTVSQVSVVYPVGQSAVKQGDLIRINAKIADVLGNFPSGIASATYDGTALGGVSTETLFDDGQHNDGAAGDGWYASDLLSVRNKKTASFSINVTANDDAVNKGTNSGTINIDNTPPVVKNVQTVYDTSGSPTQDGKSVYFTANVSDTGTIHGIAGLGVTANATAFGGDAAVLMNDDGLGNDKVKGDGIYSSESVIVKTGLATGTFPVSVTAKDIAFNTLTQSGSVAIDNAKVAVTMITPFTDEYLSGIYTVRAGVVDNYAVSKVSLDITTPTGAISINNIAYDSSSGEYRYVLNTTAIPDGDYSVQATVYDIFGLSKTSSIVPFHVDNSIPVLEFVQPTQNSVIIEKTYQIQAMASDNKSLSEVQYQIDSGTWNNLVLSGTLWTYNWDTTAMADGNHTISIRATDAIGHLVEKSILVRVDNNHPILTAISMPPITTKTVKGDLFISVGASDSVALKDVTLKLNNGTEVPLFTNGTPGIFVYTIKTDTFPSEQLLTLTVTAYDMLLHNVSITRTVLVDRTPPTIIDGSKLNTDIKKGDFFLWINATDGGCGVDYVQISIDNRPWINMTKSTAYTDAWTYNFSSSANDNGVHLIKIRAFDKIGNVAESDFSQAKIQNKDWNYLLFTLGVIISVILLIIPLALRGKSEKADKTKKGFNNAPPMQSMPPPQQSSFGAPPPQQQMMEPMAPPPPPQPSGPLPPPPPPAGQKPVKKKKGLFG